MRRLGYLDWLRGIAVLIMIQAHTLDAWTRLDARTHPAYPPLVILAGFGAPIFLFLAGVALALAAGARQRRGWSDPEVAVQARRRALQIFGLAFLFRLQSWLISGGPFSSILKVDILNVMGLGMLAGSALWALGRSRLSRLGWLAVGAAACTLVTPLIRDAALLTPLPDRLEAYFRPIAGRTTFSLFPWAGFLLAGAAVGMVLDTAQTPSQERRVNRGLAVLGVGAALAGYAASHLPPIYPEVDFWTSSPTFFLLRIGVLMAAVPFAYTWSTVHLPTSALEQMGRSSLFVYWIHVEMVYGVVSMPLHRALTFWPAVGAFGSFSLFLYLLVRLKDRLASRQAEGSAAQTSTV